MSIATGRYELGPDDAKLTVHTRKGGAAAKAGHNLTIEVTSWSGALMVDDDPAATTVELTADAGSLVVLEGHGGIQALGEDEKSSIKQTITDDILNGGTIAFHSSSVEPSENGGPLRVHGELDLLGNSRPLTFDLEAADDGRLSGVATIKQTDFGIKPYSALFGTLKVLDEVEIQVVGHLPAA
ncbi:MAG TPA: YceI family protein [Solirubrobacterales bacterium]